MIEAQNRKPSTLAARRMAAACSGAALLFAAMPARASECHLADNAAIICMTPTNAGRAWVKFGDNPGTVNGTFLRQYGCGFAFHPLARVRVSSIIPVPAPHATIPVAATEFDGGLWYIATGFLAGECTPGEAQ